MHQRGTVLRGHAIRLLTLIERLMNILASSGVTYWFMGEILRDSVCFGRLLATTRYAMAGAVSTHFD
jgi:hypothetical protein